MQNRAKGTRRGAPVTERRRIPMGIRVTPELREELVARAEAKGRSITQEMELLLEQALLVDKIGGDGLRALLPALIEFDRSGSDYARKRGIEGDWTQASDAYQYAL